MNLAVLPDWLNATGSVIGGVGTVGTLFLTYRLFRHELAKRDDERQAASEAAESAQACQVMAWSTGWNSSADGPGASYYIANNSSAPIYQCCLALAGKPGAALAEGTLVCQIVAPTSTTDGEIRVRRKPQPGEQAPKLELVFVDAAGRRWRREGLTLHRWPQ